MISFEEKVQSEIKRSDHLREVIRKIKGFAGKKVLIISHDDPDGVTSANILGEVLDKVGAKEIYTEFPGTFVLEDSQAVSFNEKYSPDTVIITDKGTFKFYDNFLKYFKEFVIIDHHFTDSFPEKTTFFNPASEGQPFCSASYINNMIAQEIGARSEFTDLMTLIGMKGDFVIEPITNIVSDYVKEFYAEVTKQFPNLFEALDDVTMFDVEQQKKTALLNKFTEAIHADTGGAFQYFYNGLSPKTKDIFPPAFTADALKSLKDKIPCIKSRTNVNSLIDCMTGAEELKLMYKFFKEDWNRVKHFLDTSVYLGSFGDTALYTFTSDHLPLLPMIISLKIFELIKRDSHKKGILISINKTDEGVHFSLRGTGDSVHCGKIGNNLALNIKKSYGSDKNVTGGGHPKAAECKIMTDEVSYVQALSVFAELIKEMTTAAENKEKSVADRLGLEYLKKGV